MVAELLNELNPSSLDLDPKIGLFQTCKTRDVAICEVAIGRVVIQTF
jgi:hypothetical protein